MLRQAQHKQFRGALALLTTLALTAPAPAQTPPREPTAYDRAIAAGYKALTLCSAMFVAGRKQADVEALELTGVYPEYDRIVPTLAAQVDSAIGAVTVAFADDLPPRRAAWTPGRGCVIDAIGQPPPIHPAARAFSPGPAPPDPRRWPLGDAGIAPRPSPALASAIATAFTLTGPRTAGVLILREGQVAAERYATGFGPFTANRTWSVAKSITGTLAGSVVGQRKLDVTAAQWIPEWNRLHDPRAAITLDHLLRMASGLHTDAAGNRTDLIYFGGGAVAQDIVHWPLEARSGTRFRYSNTDSLLVMRALKTVIGDAAYRELPTTALFVPLGMRHTVAETDPWGDFILSSQVWSTARDLARFGMLYLNDGVWNGKRILPEGWVKYVTTPSGPQPDGEFGYGATFWLMHKSPASRPTPSLRSATAGNMW